MAGKKSRSNPKKTPSTPPAAPQPEPKAPSPKPQAQQDLVRFHLKFGWWSLLVFLTLGIVLETLHGFKASLYLDVSNETRRLMWTLAHAHGVLLSLVHMAFAVAVNLTPGWQARRQLASRCLMAAGVLMPVGFFLGGVFFFGGDPGLGVFLVPVGALALFVGVFVTARAVGE